MKIASANLQLSATHVAQQEQESSESLKMWVGDRRPNFAGESPNRPQGERVTLSAAAQAANAADSAASQAVDGSSAKDDEIDPKLRLIQSVVEMITGRRIHIISAQDLQSANGSAGTPDLPASGGSASPAGTPPQRAGFGVEYDAHTSYTESEQTSFAASGTVKTADGREISFNVQLDMARYYHEESSVSLRLGDAARPTDPLVLNFNGNAADLTDQRFAFDLNADGNSEQISALAPGSGYLVFDRNQNGQVDNGSELFGPASGDGFSDLAKLDGDGNGWIDESDAAFSQLQVWTPDAQGKGQLTSLSATGVGAIALAHTSTPFALKNDANQTLGQIRNSGVFLQEDGTTGTIQQIDLSA